MAEPLYTTAILRLATATVNWPRLAAPDVTVEKRAPLCGSTLVLDLALDESGRILALGMKPQACAIGQAAATLFARHAVGRNGTDIAAAHDALVVWLAGTSETSPDWPEIEQLALARAYTARHGAILLPFAAAREATTKTTMKEAG